MRVATTTTTTTVVPSDLTVDDVRAELGNPANVSDETLQTYLEAAYETAEQVCGPIGLRSVTETKYGSWGTVLLNQYPVVSVESLAVTSGTSTVASYVTGDLTVTENGQVRLASGANLAGDLVVTYTAGRASMPAGIRLGILALIRHWWSIDRGSGSVTFGAPDFEDLPNTVQNRWRPFLLGPVIA